MPRNASVRVSAEPALRTPPQNIDAERGVLGSILLDASRVMDLCIEKGFAPETFYVPAHALLFETLKTMMAGAYAVDILTLIDRLKAADRLEAVGGVDYLENLINRTPTAAHAEYYIDIVRQKYLLRSVLGAVRDTETDCYEEKESADLILSRAEQKFLNITGDRQGVKASWKNAIDQTMFRIDKLFNQPNGLGGVPTGFKNLDRKLRGLRSGEMIVLAARPSQGKTSLAMNIAECVALGRGMDGQPLPAEYAKGKPVGVFSVEMSQESLAQRMLCGFAQVPHFQIDSSLTNASAVMTKLTRGASVLGKAPIFVDDTGGIDVMDMRARARRMKKKHNIELIVIDYLQLMNCKDFAKQGRQLETSQISANVKAMAKELNIPVIVLSQLSRAPEQRGDKTAKPKMSDLRDSGAIEQDADVILLLRRPCKYPGDPESGDDKLAIVDIAKHRNGPTGEVRLDFEDSLTRFYDRVDSGHYDDATPPPAKPAPQEG